ATDNFSIGSGINTKSINRLKYTIPEEVGIASENLKKIDSIVLYNIKEKATPGCQILIAKDGKVIYRESFGYHTYKKGNFVKNEDLYDIASLTKIAATTLSVMKLSDEGSLDIDRQLKKYLPFLKNTDKGNIIIREMMAHQARLQPWIPFYLNTIKYGKPDTSLYRSSIEENYTVKVANKLYIRKDYEFTIYDSIISSKLRKRKEYKYSDLGFYLLKKSIGNITNQPFDNYVYANFYKPLGLQTICFNPTEQFKLSSIIPTENDKEFRKQLIHGYVHDPGAAMLGGVSGHAGLFSNANDLAVIMQMLLQNGEYGGKRYINSNTVAEFTKRQFPLNDNRRGIGFDKPNTDDWENGPTCESVSIHSYGHSGFTGTYAWVDPEYDLVYIFLSNRIHPTSSNTKLLKMNTRTEIQQVIYDAILKSENK
ncbi:MAG: serine hydrolase, partial [Bacteroidales bacterium]|nr:serine hydrolase [Bacteroidales bacterium]